MHINILSLFFSLRSRWPRVLIRRSAETRLLGFRIRIPHKARVCVCVCLCVSCECCVLSCRGLQVRLIICPGGPTECGACVNVVCCHVEVSKSGSSLAQRSPTECGARAIPKLNDTVIYSVSNTTYIILSISQTCPSAKFIIIIIYLSWSWATC